MPFSRLSRSDLADLNAFLAVEKLRSFTLAAKELDITTSAISHSIRNLEERLHIKLLNRTSRSVSPTAAGENLARRLALGFSEITNALDALAQHRDRPSGKLRLNVLRDSAQLLLLRHLPTFLAAYPDVEVEVAIEDRMVDILAQGFDAGIRYGDRVPKDFVAVQISKALRWVAVASPRYINSHKKIELPEDLMEQNCIKIRMGNGLLYRWDFEKDADHRTIDVPGQLCVNESQFGIDLARADCGIMYCLEETVRNALESGELQIVLPEWSPVEPPFYLYYPGNGQMAPGLKELIEVLRTGEL